MDKFAYTYRGLGSSEEYFQIEFVEAPVKLCEKNRTFAGRNGTFYVGPAPCLSRSIIRRLIAP